MNVIYLISSIRKENVRHKQCEEVSETERVWRYQTGCGEFRHTESVEVSDTESVGVSDTAKV